MYVNAEEQARADTTSLRLRGSGNTASRKVEPPRAEGVVASAAPIDVCPANSTKLKNHGVIVFKGLLFALVPSALIWAGICWVISIL